MVTCAGFLATICWLARQARKGAAEPSDSSAEIRLVRVIAQYLHFESRGYHTIMSYLVLARKWRPKAFSEVVGQQHVLRALINGLDQDRLHHAFLFAGTRGVGKTTLARIFAKSLNCEQGVSSTPCDKCQSCQEIDAGRFVDLIEVDAASRTKVDDTRELLDNVQYAPSRGRYKVYLIDEVHMLSNSSFNALLKTLEEPPPHVKFLFATTDPQKLPVTILSRCLQFNLRRLEIDQIADHLAIILQSEAINCEQAALLAIARAADGSMRDALSLLDQAISFGSGTVHYADVADMLGSIEQQQVLAIIQALIAQDGAALLQQSTELSSQGRDFTIALNELLALLQRLASLQAVPNLEQPDNEDLQSLLELSQQIDTETVQLMYQIALHGKRDLPFAADPKSGFEMTLLRMLHFQVQTTDNVTTTISPTQTKPKVERESKPAPQPKPAQTITEPEPATYQTQAVANTPTVESDVETTADIANIDQQQITADNWTTLIAGIKLTAMARQLADNCGFIKFENNKIHLSLAPAHAHLATGKTTQRLEKALQQIINETVSLILQSDESQQTGSKTLASQQAEQQHVRQQKAANSIHNDPTVDALKAAFGGRVIESTIKPIN